jgi:amino acid transporter
VFAFGGAEIALNNGGEIVKPEQTVPRGLMLGIGSIFVLYLAIHAVAQGVLGSELALNFEAPLVATAERAIGPWGRGFLLIGTGISMFGVISADLLASPRVVFAAARDGLLPSVFARVHRRHKTPYVAVLFYSGLACGFALTGAFKTLAVVGSGSLLLIYLGTSLAVLQLRRRGQKAAPTLFRVPGGPIVPILSACVVGWLLLSMTSEEAVGLVALVAAGCVLYLVMMLVRSRSDTPSDSSGADD